VKATNGIQTTRETERKYEAADEVRLPDLTRLMGADNSAAAEDQQLDALYFDTPTCGCCGPESRCAAARAARTRAGI
jgi:hypothetical protein